MKKLFTIAILVGAALLSTRWSHTPNENRKINVVHSERILELAKAEDGRLDLSILLASSRLPDERKKAFLDADEDNDGFLTQDEFMLATPSSRNNPDAAVKKNVVVTREDSEVTVSRETTSVNHELDEALRELEVWFYSENQSKAPLPRHKNERHSPPEPSRFQKKPKPRPHKYNTV